MSGADPNLQFTENQDVMKMTTPLDQTLLIRTLTIKEAISEPYQILADVYCASPDIDFNELLGQKVSIFVELSSESARYFHGAVSRVSQGATVGSVAKHDVTLYQVDIRPSFWFLEQTRTCRIFSEKSAKEILETIFGESREIDFEYQFHLKPNAVSSLPVEYCVQYNESDFAFCSRIMEEFGLGYYFVHEEDVHRLVVFDRWAQHNPCPSNATARFWPIGENQSLDVATPRISSFDVSRSFSAGKFSTSDFDPEDPGNPEDPGAKQLVSTTVPAEAVGCNDEFEIFEFPGEYRDRERHGQDLTDQFSCVAQREAYRGVAVSSCPGFTSGFTFEMTDHPRETFNNDYLITSVEHVITQPVSVVSGGEEKVSYRGKLTFLPYRDDVVPFVPAQKTPKPSIYGIQSATIVSTKAGSSIDIDEQGRVLVKFPWDRSKDTISRRIRLSQNEAGKGWGTMAIPHSGHEVLVSYLNGDPDHPVIVGRVYNAANPPAQNAIDNTSRTEIRVHKGVHIEIEGGSRPKLGTF